MASEKAEKIPVKVRQKSKTTEGEWEEERKIQPREIEIREVEEPRVPSPEATIDWIFRCLGGSEEDKLAREIFKELVQMGKRGVRSRDLQRKTRVTQGAIVYHLNTFMRCGLVSKQGRYYYLRGHSLDRTLEEMENEIVRRFERMKRLAKMIEDEMEREMGRF